MRSESTAFTAENGCREITWKPGSGTIDGGAANYVRFLRASFRPANFGQANFGQAVPTRRRFAMNATASVVIACHTEERWALLLKAVDSVRDQTVRAAQIIVVVDHNPMLFRRLRHLLAGVTVLENGELAGASGARNTGAFHATSPYVAFLDDDAAAEPDWLAQIVVAFSDPSVVGTGGRVEPDWTTARPAWFPEEFDWVVGASYRGMPTRREAVRNVWAENMAVRKDVFELVHGFRTGFGKIGGHSRPEDTDVCIRMAQAVAGGRWMYEPDAVVAHHVPAGRSTYAFFLRRAYHEGRGKAELARLLPTPADALTSERTYVRRTLPVGVLRHLARAVVWVNVGELAKALNIVAGLVSTAWGFGLQSALDRRVERPLVLVDSTLPEDKIEAVS